MEQVVDREPAVFNARRVSWLEWLEDETGASGYFLAGLLRMPRRQYYELRSKGRWKAILAKLCTLMDYANEQGISDQEVMDQIRAWLKDEYPDLY